MGHLSHHVLELLMALNEANGSATLDRFGRLEGIRGGDQTVTILNMVSHGLIGGEGGRIILTELGRETALAETDSRITKGAA